MSTSTAATAVAPTAISNKDVAINLVQNTFGIAHLVFTGLADVVKYGEARIVNKIDSNITVQASLDYRDAITNKRLEKMRNGMSGYKKEVIE
jgi:hypothetical protein